MSQICDNTTPLGSKNASEILTETSAALQDAIIDLQTLATREPTGSLNRETVIVATNALNNVLANTDLSSLTSLKDKFDSTDGITYTDIAEFAINTSTDLDTLRDELVKFNAKLPGGDSTNSGSLRVSDITGQPIGQSTTSNTFDTGSGEVTPLGGNVPISTSSSGDLLANLQRASNITGLLSGRLPLLPTLLPDLLSKVLKDLDFQFANNLGSKLTDAVCGAYSDVSSKLTKAFAVVNTGKVILADVSNLLEKDPKKLLEQIKQRATLESLVGILENVITATIETAKRTALAAVGATLLTIDGIGSASSAVMKKMSRGVKEINDYMADASVDKIVKDIEATVAELASSFERLTPEAVANLMFKMCQKSQDLQATLMKPAKKLNSTANSIAAEVTALKSQNAQTTQKAVKAGAIRVSEETRKEKVEKVIEKSKETVKEQKKQKQIKPIDREADIVTHRRETAEERQLVVDILGKDFTGTTQLTSRIGFSSRIAASVDEIKLTKPIVLARLIRLSEQADEYFDIVQGTVNNLTLNKGLRREAIGDRKSGSLSLNMHNTGWAIDISCDEFNREDLIVAASQVGFTGIGVTPEFLHLDLGTRRGFQKGFERRGQDFEDIQAILEKHEIDGFRKKRS